MDEERSCLSGSHFCTKLRAEEQDDPSRSREGVFFIYQQPPTKTETGIDHAEETAFKEQMRLPHEISYPSRQGRRVRWSRAASDRWRWSLLSDTEAGERNEDEDENFD